MPPKSLEFESRRTNKDRKKNRRDHAAARGGRIGAARKTNSRVEEGEDKSEGRDGRREESVKTREKESGREEDAPLSASPETNQTGARLANQRHPSAAAGTRARRGAERTDAVDADG